MHPHMLRHTFVTTMLVSARPAAAFATGVGLELPVMAAPVGVLAAPPGMVRMVSGVHFPSDIAGGSRLAWP
jgi:membrane-associated phospholipid phosphatase